MEFIDVIRIAPDGVEDGSALGISDRHPESLQIVGVLPHNYKLKFNKENAKKMIDWLQGQFPEDVEQHSPISFAKYRSEAFKILWKAVEQECKMDKKSIIEHEKYSFWTTDDICALGWKAENTTVVTAGVLLTYLKTILGEDY